ncbi:kinase-like protein [Auricularia subglabra TFB-10046 SS5]|nr:kinase-like protein [Auricularia subglabra TFB-10046 SS5]
MKLYREKVIDYGGFSRVYDARVTSCSGVHHLKLGQSVAVKKCHITKHVRNATLQHEACALLLLKGHISTPAVYAWGRSQYYEYVAMEKLGEDVSSVLKAERGLTLRSLVGIICQMLDALGHVHAHGFIHCDIKPQNFLFKGMISGLVGTPHYASIPVHRHHQPSRRDDMESLAYTIVKLLRGRLPWKETKQKDLLHAKLTWDGSSICAGYPAVFADFFDYARQLPFDAEPDYDRWRSSFDALVGGSDDVFGRIIGQPVDAVEPRLKDSVEVEAPPSTSDDDELTDSDDGWFPTSS